MDEAIGISRSLAEALEAAHENGVIHRDLKPANIKVDPEGQVKVLDFGLAKAFAEETPDSDSSFLPTLSREATQAGVILGTAAYMSAEQAKGKAVDKRSDVFSFGIVLYEMLTGRKAFAGEDVLEILASILKLEPTWEALPAGLDPRIVRLLRRRLRKDRRNRLQAIGDVRVEIQDVLAEPMTATGPGTPAASAPQRARLDLAISPDGGRIAGRPSRPADHTHRSPGATGKLRSGAAPAGVSLGTGVRRVVSRRFAGLVGGVG